MSRNERSHVGNSKSKPVAEWRSKFILLQQILRLQTESLHAAHKLLSNLGKTAYKTERTRLKSGFKSVAFLVALASPKPYAMARHHIDSHTYR